MIFAAAVLSAVWAITHIVVGGAQVARVLQAAPMDTIARETALLVWHMMTFVLILLAALLFWAGWSGSVAAATLGLILAGGLSAVGFAVQWARGQGLAVLPQGALFLPVAALVAAGLLA